MKTRKFTKTISCLFILCVSLFFNPLNSQNIGINTTGALPNTKAMLDIDVNGLNPKTGLLVPRMTTTERNAITAPIPESLLIYNTTTQCFEAWNQTAAVWVPFGCIGCTTPVAPLANAGTSATTSGFTANWVSVAGATSYLLDISTSPTFASFVSGYNSFNAGNTFISAVSSLTCATTYYYRVRAINACGTSASSNTISVTTSSCSVANPLCGTQVWATANLNAGTMITGVTNQTNNGIVEKYCYNDVPANCTTYGGLYQWDEMMNYTSSINCDPCGASGRQGICPTGYHVPTDLEWSRYEFCMESNIAPAGGVTLNDFQTLTNYRGTTTGSKLKASSSNTPAWDGNNSSGFTAIDGGARTLGGTFGGMGTYAQYLTATEDNSTNVWHRQVVNGNTQIYRERINKGYGQSVRCLQD